MASRSHLTDCYDAAMVMLHRGFNDKDTELAEAIDAAVKALQHLTSVAERADARQQIRFAEETIRMAKIKLGQT